MLAMRHILFVCTANQCRSPMAAGLFSRQIAHLGEADRWHVSSAGTWAEDQRPATMFARTTMAEQNIDISGHRSRLLDGDLLRGVDVILVMTRHHQEAIRAEFPDVADRTFMISQLIGQTFDITDPVQGTLDDYRRCAADLQQILRDGYNRLAELADRGAGNHSN
jgi:protein-tyrosine-phosphatase